MGHMQDLILMFVTEISLPEVVLAWQVDFSIIASIKVREGCSIHAGASWGPDSILEAVMTILVSCSVTVVMKQTSAPVFSVLLSPVAPVVAFRLILADGLAVGGCVEVLHLHDQVVMLIAQQALGHIAGRQASGSGGLHLCSGLLFCGGSRSGSGSSSGRLGSSG